ncbi:hypothetical protein RRG08_022629 [Elysia crispata]|uniref:Uncharacterized protein n=1 Tax=Elysia crispata TaxID=231223 RepID=A0AAE0Z1R1_9GAST|nr:hypothetical protein RRG08_022629 [Elysia crispata]
MHTKIVVQFFVGFPGDCWSRDKANPYNVGYCLALLSHHGCCVQLGMTQSSTRNGFISLHTRLADKHTNTHHTVDTREFSRD